MTETYKILPGVDAPHRDATIASAEEYAKFIIKCATRTMTERLEVARQFGWDSGQVLDTVFFVEYQKKRAQMLFPGLSEHIEKEHNLLVIPEVDRAEENFTRVTGIALREPSLSLRELGDFLTNLTLAANRVDVNLTSSSEHQVQQ